MQDDSIPAGTRADLIAAGLHLFGRDGFAATSTRALAAQAGTNVASIAYHFGGKEGLRLACADEVLRRIAMVAGPAMPRPLSGHARRDVRRRGPGDVPCTFAIPAIEADPRDSAI